MFPFRRVHESTEEMGAVKRASLMLVCILKDRKVELHWSLTQVECSVWLWIGGGFPESAAEIGVFVATVVGLRNTPTLLAYA